MDLKIVQKKIVEVVDAIDAKRQSKHDSDTTFVHLIEELGEIVRELYNEKSGRDKIHHENLKEEIADVIILSTKFADNYNIDLEDAIVKKLEVLKKRHSLD